MKLPPKPPHIDLRADGHPMVGGAGYKVIMLLTEHVAWGSDAAELVSAHPSLTHDQAHAVIEYYQEHKEDIDQILAERERRSRALQASRPASPVKAKLLALRYRSGLSAE